LLSCQRFRARAFASEEEEIVLLSVGDGICRYYDVPFRGPIFLRPSSVVSSLTVASRLAGPASEGPNITGCVCDSVSVCKPQLRRIIESGENSTTPSIRTYIYGVRTTQYVVGMVAWAIGFRDFEPVVPMNRHI
jgi:hypothetical protein